MTAMTEQMTAETRSGRTVSHGTFTLERTFPMPRRTVFAAWAAKESKNEWFGEGDDFLESVDEYSLDFRTGGREHLAGVLGGSGNHFVYDALYGDIVDGERIVATYEVLINGRRISVSLLTVEFEELDGGTRLVMTEQGAFLDGIDTNEQRIEGATDSLDNLEAWLNRQGT